MFERDAAHVSTEGSFDCSLCPNGNVCLRWRQTLLLHLGQGDLTGVVQCLEDILAQPACSFFLGSGPFCACRAADDHYYLVCQDRVVLRLREEEARHLHRALTTARNQLERAQGPLNVM